MKTAREFAYRIANQSDASGIFAILEAVADEIPLLIDTNDRRKALRKVCRKCISSNESIVTVDASGNIIGFLLVAPDEMESFYCENNALHMHYGGVKIEQRGRGIFPTLVAKVIERSVPLTATVKNANRSQMGKRLEALGFTLAETRSDEKRYRRE